VFVWEQITMIVRFQDMEENKIVVATLTQEWKTLREDIQKNKRLEFSAFEDVFSKTYKLLSQISMDATVEKQYINLIVNAFLFANSDSKDLEFKYLAAMVLTERMLNTVISEEPKASRSEAKIYVLELRQEVSLSFENIGESINTLVKLYDGDFWDKFGQ
jgi:hypothetical protein